MSFSKIGSLVVGVGMVSILAIAAASQTMHAQNDRRIGTWKLNLEKSTFNPGPAPKSQTRTYEVEGNGVKTSVEGVGADGKPVSYGFTSSLDGKEVPITGTAPYG